MLQFVKEEAVDAGDFVDFFGGDAVLQCFKYREKPAVVPVGKAILHTAPVYGGGVQAVQRDFRSFISAASKLVPIAITSPVAFIWVPSFRLIPANLSNGHLGNLTTT